MRNWQEMDLPVNGLHYQIAQAKKGVRGYQTYESKALLDRLLFGFLLDMSFGKHCAYLIHQTYRGSTSSVSTNTEKYLSLYLNLKLNHVDKHI